jgi:hypothetical protein
VISECLTPMIVICEWPILMSVVMLQDLIRYPIICLFYLFGRFVVAKK